MPDFPTALSEALSDHYGAREDFRSPVESKRGFEARVRALEKSYGGGRKAAAAAGIHPDTWTRWKHGQRTPSRASLARIAIAHMSLLRAGKVARKGYPSRFEITATVSCTPVTGSLTRDPKKSRYYNGGRPGATAAHRTFRADKLSSAQVANVVTAWAAGKGPQDVADVLIREIERSYPGRFEFEGNNVTVTVIN